MPDHENVIIIGGGVIGCAIAQAIAPDVDVTVIEKGQLASEATGLSAGVVCPESYYTDAPEIAIASHRFFETFGGPSDGGFIRRTRIDLISEGEVEQARKDAERLSRAGLNVSLIELERLKQVYPRVRADRFGGAIEYENSGWIDPHRLAVALQRDAENNGAVFHTNTKVEQIQSEENRVIGVSTDDGELPASSIVVAAGWRTSKLLSEYIELPIQPWEFSVATLEPAQDLGSGFPMGRSNPDGIYFRPEENGDLLVGNGERPARDPEQQSTGTATDESFRLDVASFVSNTFPLLAESAIANHWLGVEGITPDGRPIVDVPEDGPQGLVVAQASALGIMTCPPIAQAARFFITGEEPIFPVEPFSLHRFTSLSSDFEANGIVGSQ